MRRRLVTSPRSAVSSWCRGEVRVAGDHLLPGDQMCQGVVMNQRKSSLTVKRGDGSLLNVGASELVVLNDCTLVPVGCFGLLRRRDVRLLLSL